MQGKLDSGRLSCLNLSSPGAHLSGSQTARCGCQQRTSNDPSLSCKGRLYGVKLSGKRSRGSIDGAGESLRADRERAMLCVAYETLARRGELVALAVRDIDFHPNGLVRRSFGAARRMRRGRGGWLISRERQ